MPVIRFFRSVPAASGGVSPATGRVRFRPTRPRTVPGAPDNVVLPVPFTVPLIAGAASVTLEPSPAGSAWRVDESIDGIRDVTYYVLVPDVPGPVDDADLVRVDPGTLAPTATPEASWWPVANATITSAEIVGPDLILTRHDGATVNAGPVIPSPAALTAAVQATIPPNVAWLYLDTDGRPYFAN